MRKRIILIVVSALAVVVIWLALRGRAVPVELAQVTAQTVREYIAEDAKTRLADEFVVAMPVSGTLKRISFDVGDVVERGQCVARVDSFALEQQIKGAEALTAQARAQIEGVDATKPKSEEVESSAVRAREARDAERIAGEELAIAELQHGEATKEYERARALQAEGAVSQAHYDEAERLYKQSGHNRERAQLALQAAKRAREVAELTSQRVAGSIEDNEYLRKVYQAEIDRLDAELGITKDDLGKTEILSPVTGPIVEKYVEDEVILAPGTPLLKIGSLASIEIECDVLSEEVGRLKVGDPVEITGKALDDRTVTGSVSRIYPAGFKKISSLGIEQQRVRTLIAFDNGEADLRPGTSVEVKIITEEHADVLAVPERATFRHDGQWSVFTVRRGKARLTPVDIGLKNDDWAEITEGLDPGDTIIAEPKNDLEDDVRVTAY